MKDPASAQNWKGLSFGANFSPYSSVKPSNLPDGGRPKRLIAEDLLFDAELGQDGWRRNHGAYLYFSVADFTGNIFTFLRIC